MKPAFFVTISALLVFSHRFFAGEVPKLRFDALKMDCDTHHGGHGVAEISDKRRLTGHT
jgi:hypothetical protein